MTTFDENALIKECDFKASLSGGPGGQHANKTATKVELNWDIRATQVFSDEKTALLLRNLRTRSTTDGILQLSSDATRSQHQNKRIVTDKFLALIQDALKVPKKRKRTKPTKMSKLKRLNNKKKNAEKKERRKRPER